MGYDSNRGEELQDVTRARHDLRQHSYYQKVQQDLLARNKGIEKAQQPSRHQDPPVMPDIQDKVQIEQQQRSLFSWKTVNNKGRIEYELDLSDPHAFATSILTSDKSLGIINMLGLRIDMREKLQKYIDKYVKSFVQARSHNLMIAKFAQFNVAFIGQLLSLLGMTSGDIRKLQQQALETAIEENMQLFAENEYNSEMIAVVGGGSKKEIKGQQKIISEMRTQFITQMQRLGAPDYYTETRIKEIQIEQLKKIITSFYEEKNNIEFQRDYLL